MGLGKKVVQKSVKAAKDHREQVRHSVCMTCLKRVKLKANICKDCSKKGQW